MSETGREACDVGSLGLGDTRTPAQVMEPRKIIPAGAHGVLQSKRLEDDSLGLQQTKLLRGWYTDDGHPHGAVASAWTRREPQLVGHSGLM